jgi:Tol biopolymer transport system component/DNA-binding winged helix-turn-helix (wHTH) protein
MSPSVKPCPADSIRQADGPARMNLKPANAGHVEIYSFGEYTLDTKSRAVRHGEQLVELTPKQFQTLLVLVENHDRIVSKDELLKTVWPEQFVEESNVTQNVCVLRKQLGEVARGKKFIETFPGRGYRFSEIVDIVDPPQKTNGNGLHDGIDPGPEHSSAPLGSSRVITVLPEPGRPACYKRPVIAVLCLVAGLLLLAIVLRSSFTARKPPAPVVSQAQLRTFSRMNGTQTQPSWSRDGEHVAFVYLSPDGLHSAIYVQSVQDVRPVRVASGEGKFSSPVWSPDGKRLAYLRLLPNRAMIVILNLATGTETKLASLFPRRYQLNYRHLDWSPDGSFLAVDDKEVESDPLSLYLVSVSTGEKIRLTYPSWNIVGDVTPRFSPDGTQVAFLRLKYITEHDVFVVPVTGGEQRRLTETSSRLGDVDWENNHSLIYSGKSSGEFQFWRVNLQSPHPAPVLASSLETDLQPDFSISRQNHEIVLSSYQPDLNIWSVDLSKPHPTAADWTRIIQTPGQDIQPAFSLDGSKIAYRSDVSGKVQIWVCNADGSGAFQINTGSILPETKAWAPDSKSIVFASLGRLYFTPISPQPHLRLIASPQVSHPAFSTDGAWIFAQENYFIYRIPVAGGVTQQISKVGGPPMVESADGRYLYFGHGRMDTNITRLDLQTGQQEDVIQSLIPGYREAWALTQTGIFYLTERSGVPTIAFHSFSTGQDREIAPFNGDLPPFSMSAFSVSPDGKRLLVVRADPVFADLQIATF